MPHCMIGNLILDGNTRIYQFHVAVCVIKRAVLWVNGHTNAEKLSSFLKVCSCECFRHRGGHCRGCRYVPEGCEGRGGGRYLQFG